jgi:hypothetical protein
VTGDPSQRPGAAGPPAMCRGSVSRWAVACLAGGVALLAVSVAGVVLLVAIR